MDKLESYRKFIQDIIEDYRQCPPSSGEVEMEAVVDKANDHYQLMTVGWNKHVRVHGTLIHVDIRDGKFWVQYDGTEESVANRLVDLGVPRQDIVLAFHSASHRRYTDFAVN